VKSTHRRHRERMLWAALLAALLLAGALAWMVPWAPKPARRVEASVLAPDKSFFSAFDFALSPDGTKLAFVAQGNSNRGQLWVRPLDSGVAQPLAGTEDAGFPFWSPDSENIGFFAEGKMKRVAASGGPVQTLAEASEGRGGTWNKDDVVLFTPTTGDAIYRVSAAGGPVTQISHLDGRTQTSHRWPWFLPDGKHYLLLVRGGTGVGSAGKSKDSMSGIFLGSIDSPDLTFLTAGDRRPMYANGYVIYPRDAYLEAQPFDPKRLKVIGDPVPLAEHVLTDDRWTGAFAVSQDGKLMYLAGMGRATDLQWHDRSGKPLGLLANGTFNVMRISADASRAAVSVSEGGAPLDIWMYDLKRNLRTRFTFNPADEDDPVWSPDGKNLYYDSAQSGTYNIYRKATDGSGKEELLLDTPQVKYTTGISPDGRYLIFESVDANNKSQYDLSVLPLVGDHTPIPFAHTEYSERMGSFSPDGKWIAYTSSESGRTEVYVAPFPPTGAKFQVSSGGGGSPKWRGDGKELFYYSDDGHIVAVEITLGAGSVQIGASKPLFEVHATNALYAFDVTRDGQRFLVMERPVAGTNSLTLVMNWVSGLKKK
jgi:eukaryotic-like serine/threonine-protein kinase